VTTIAQNMRVAGFKANLRVRGRCMDADTGETVTVLVQDAPVLSDPDKPAQKKKPVYAQIFALAAAFGGTIKDPRAVETFTQKDTGQVFTVFSYDETTGDAVTWKWFCEAQREDFNV
jgi:hypothetical protein